MNILVLGSGMMGKAIAYDLERFSDFEKITVADQNKSLLTATQQFFHDTVIEFIPIHVENQTELRTHFKKHDLVISAIPFRYNYTLARLAVQTNTHFLDLGGNTDIVHKEQSLFSEAKKKKITIIPDCGLAPGLTSVITRDIIDHFKSVEYVKLRVGGLPVHPQPPLQYQIVFSPYGLINEYREDAIVLDHGTIQQKPSMSEIEAITFPQPFGILEAFLTSGGCSTLPHTYQNSIGYLDYKTIRYPGHCEKFKLLLELGFADTNEVVVGEKKIVPRDLFAQLLLSSLPQNQRDVVLLKVVSKGLTKKGNERTIEYLMIDYYDEHSSMTAMMRTTGYPVSITAQLIQQNIIKEHGVFCSEEVVPPTIFFKELQKRHILITKTLK